jgi:hypothetical protein
VLDALPVDGEYALALVGDVPIEQVLLVGDDQWHRLGITGRGRIIGQALISATGHSTIECAAEDCDRCVDIS